MKTSIATTVSVAAVLVAGGAAFAVNTRALNNSDTSKQEAVPTLVTTVTSNETDTQKEFELAGIGVISLKLSATTLAVAKVQTENGFTYSSWQIASDQVRVEFRSATSDIEFRARLIDGRVVTDVKSSNPGKKFRPNRDHNGSKNYENPEMGEDHEDNDQHGEQDEHHENEGHDDDD
jgi:hypothetical protein